MLFAFVVVYAGIVYLVLTFHEYATLGRIYIWKLLIYMVMFLSKHLNLLLHTFASRPKLLRRQRSYMNQW